MLMVPFVPHACRTSGAMIMHWSLVVLVATGAHAYTYDTVQQWKTPIGDCTKGCPAGNQPAGCTYGCASWANLTGDGSPVNQTAADLLWRNRTMQAQAGRSCAQPGGSPFHDEHQTAGFAGSWCFCAKAHGIASPVGCCLQDDVDLEHG